MTVPPLLVLSLEGFATSALGCYGSSWNHTPTVDAIADGGCVWGRCVAPSDDPIAVLREAMSSAAWREPWSQRGSMELITDDPALMEDQKQWCFDRIDTVSHEPPTPSDLPAIDIVDSQLGQLFAAAIERDSHKQDWSVLWLHSRFLTQCWDAPRDLFPIDETGEEVSGPSEEVELLTVDIDPVAHVEPLPPIFESVLPPRVKLESDDDPDLVTSWMRTYGCQIRLLDTLIDLLLTSLHADDPIVVLLGTSGFRLGQGGWIGHHAGPLRSPDIHLPLIVSDNGPLRIGKLTSSRDLGQLLCDLGRGTAPLIDPNRWSQANDSTVETRSVRAQQALSTPQWFYVRDADSSEHLFLKPDDIEDFNDVGRIRGDVLDSLSESKK